VRWEKKVADDERTMVIEGTHVGLDTLPIEKVEFFHDASDNYEIQGATEKIPTKTDFALRKTVRQFSEWPSKISGVVVIEGNGITKGDDPDRVKSLMASPRIQGFWRLHRNIRHPELDGPEDMIANPVAGPAGDHAYNLRLRILKSGAVTVINERNGFNKTYHAGG